ncbi:uncharacterized protein PFL1_00980 [Pseudozyma flocculosa PF-1]|nr:uncharacterized protein PFL1_00980 [Pseudozyma flocculosa PF-1]EPQ31647.1 hypothetical protein PFL1_00980 [Pseudozyma flocculosa PF-1]
MSAAPPKGSGDAKPVRVRGRQRPTDHKTGPKGEPMTPIPSATLVVLCPRSTSGPAEAVSYDTLMVQRSARDGSSFRSAVVFPGGALDLADEEAIDVALASSAERSSGGKPASTTPEGFLLALKLCALRETFEETGLLLVPSASPSQPGGIPISRAIGHEEAGIPKDEWDHIRDEVHNDAVHFVPFLQRVTKALAGEGASAASIGASLPALAPMAHHSNWITPRAVVRPAKRFDAHFFVTALDAPDAFGKDNKTLALSADGSETLSLRLGTPREIIDLGLADQISLFPPQFYILADLEAAIGPQTTTASRRFQPLIFAPSSPATYTPAAEYRVTPIEEEQRGLTGRQNFSWDRTDPPASGKASGASSDKTSWVGDTQPPLNKQRDLGLHPDRIDPRVTVVEPKGLPKQGAMVSLGRKKGEAATSSAGEAEEEETPFVFPLVLPGDWQASPSQQERIKTAFSVPSSSSGAAASGQATTAGGQQTSEAATAPAPESRPLNRLYVSPRPAELGGGMTVRGCVRRSIGTLQDFQIGIQLQDKSGDAEQATRRAKI